MAELNDKAKAIIASQGFLRIGDTAPNFKQETTQGPIDFYDYTNGKWAILFSQYV